MGEREQDQRHSPARDPASEAACHPPATDQHDGKRAAEDASAPSAVPSQPTPDEPRLNKSMAMTTSPQAASIADCGVLITSRPAAIAGPPSMAADCSTLAAVFARCTASWPVLHAYAPIGGRRKRLRLWLAASLVPAASPRQRGRVGRTCQCQTRRRVVPTCRRTFGVRARDGQPLAGRGQLGTPRPVNGGRRIWGRVIGLGQTADAQS